MKSPTCLVLLILVLLLTPTVVRSQSSHNARVIAEKANLRETPSSIGLAEGEVPEGTIVKVLDEKLPWYVVRVGDRVGWMHGATLMFIDISERSPETTPYRMTTAPATPTYSDTPSYPTRSSDRSGGYIRGPRGGCYYIGGSGRKVYVDRSMCN